MQKRGFGLNKTSLLIFIFIFSMLFISSVYAADVAYIYSRNFKIDNNVVNAFSDLGLTTDLIKESQFPSNLSKYKILYIGDELFSSPGALKVGEIPTIIANYYHGPDFGLTDNEGVSQLGSNSPLDVILNGSLIRVYTKATQDYSSLAVHYYFLDNNNRAPALKEIAGASTDHSSIGSVIAYANSGSKLLNGKTIKSNLCFFGIIQSKYWTQGAKSMFNNCAAFVSAKCKTNLDCDDSDDYTEDICLNPGKVNATCIHTPIECFAKADCGTDGLTGSPECTLNNVTQLFKAYECENPGTTSSKCSSTLEKKNIEECPDFCQNGQCKSFVCKADSDCGIDRQIENPFCSANNVTQKFLKFACSNPSTADAFCSNATTQETVQQCPDYCSNGVCETFPCHNDSECNDNNQSTIDKCINPSTINASCSNEPIPPIFCDDDSDCNDNNPLTFDECINPGTANSSCRNTLVNCISDSSCGFTGFFGQESCSLNDVVKSFQNATCLNPATLNSFCKIDIIQKITNQCQFACVNASCIRCDSDSDCNDNNSSTLDECINPGTLGSTCANPPKNETNQTIACKADSDCGTDGFIGEKSCTLNNVTQLFHEFKCNNQGTQESYCSNSTMQKTIEQCAFQCSNGQCINQTAPIYLAINSPENKTYNISLILVDITAINATNIWYSINNGINITFSMPVLQTFQEGINTLFASASNAFGGFASKSVTFNVSLLSNATNQTIRCNNDIECGGVYPIGDLFCSSRNVSRIFANNKCNQPGTPESYCSSSNSTATIQVCPDYCLNGECKTFRCNNDSECNDNNPLTFDECINPGTIASSCRNTLVNCISDSDCGFTGFTGIEFCSIKDVFKNFQNATCINPGTLNAFCSVSSAPKLIAHCPLACSNGICIACNSNADCNDNNSGTADICNFPGTIQSYCSHIPSGVQGSEEEGPAGNVTGFEPH